MTPVKKDRRKEQIKKWLIREIKSHNKRRSNTRISNHPKFSYKFDNKSKVSKVILCYSIPKPDPSSKKGWRLVQKQLYKKYSNTNNYKETLRVFDDYEFILKEHQESLEEIHVDDRRIKYWIERYCDGSPRRGIQKPSEKTIVNDRSFLNGYHLWLKSNKPKYTNLWSHTDGGRIVFLEYLNYKRDEGSWSDSTIFNMYKICRSFFNWVHSRENSFPDRLLSELKELPKPKIVTSSFSEVEFEKILQFMDDEKESLQWGWFISILRLLLVTGVRISEAQSMKINDLSFETLSRVNKDGGFDSQEVIRWTMIGKGQDGGKERTIYIDSDTMISDIMKQIKTPEGKFRTDKEYVFHKRFYKRNKNQWGDTKGTSLIEDLKKPYSVSGIGHKFKEMVRHLNLDMKLSPHSCRRFFISHMLKTSGGNIPLVANLVGHESWMMVNHYQNNNQKQEMIKGIRNTLNIGEVNRS
mgnify:FL=1